MKKTPAKIKRPLWVVGLNFALALTVGSTQAFASGAIELDQTDFYSTITADVDESLGGNYVLTEGIDIATADDGDPPSGSTVFGRFTGTLDGGGFAITGLTKPLFDFIAAAANEFSDGVEIDTVEIKDLDLYAATGEGGGITGNGALANILETGGTIDNVSFTGDISGASDNSGFLPVGIGGLVGVSEGTISNSYAAGTVDGDSYVGGLVGYSVGTISNSYAAGTVDGGSLVGGLVGVSNGGIITNSYATGDVIGLGEYIGGLVGESYGTITNSYAKGNVNDPDEVGGLVGFEVGGLVGYLGGTLSNTYATGNVSGIDYVGGLVGSTRGGATEITDSYATGNVDGAYDVGGLVGELTGDITNSYAIGNVTGEDDFGGLVGFSDGGIITNSYASGDVRSISAGCDCGDAGGLVGYSDGGIITNSYASGDVRGGEYDIGGLVGDLDEYCDITSCYGSITDSYATGNVEGIDNVGGLVGESGGTITNSYATGDVIGSGEYIGGLVGWLEARGTISNSYAKTGTVNGTGTDWGDHGIGGLVGYSSGSISGSYAEGNVNGFEQVGGLVGSTGFVTYITNSYATGNVDGTYDVGGLVGLLESEHTIADSYATGNVTGEDNFGGLVGYSDGDIDNSYATGDVTSISAGCDCYDAGGLVGYSDGTISNSYASGNVDGTYDVGGLVADLDDHGSITNSYATGNVEGIERVGGLVGELTGEITNSYATGNVDGTVEAGGLVGYSEGGITDSYGYGEATINGDPIGEDPHLGEGDAPEILSIVNFGFADPNLPFAVSASINDGLPYLISLIESYDVVEEDTEETPSFSLRSYYTQAAKSLDKALISLGFKSNFSSHPNLGFKALEQNQSNSPAVIQLFEVSEYQNSNILLNKDDGLQLSISSYYKEAVEIWTQGLNGEYLYLGLIEFDKDGKAILPTLKFDTANTYQLLMIKAADKLSEKPNLEAKVGQININVI